MCGTVPLPLVRFLQWCLGIEVTVPLKSMRHFTLKAQLPLIDDHLHDQTHFQLVYMLRMCGPLPPWCSAKEAQRWLYLGTQSVFVQLINHDTFNIDT